MKVLRNIALTLIATWLCFLVYQTGPWGTICFVGWAFLLYNILTPLDREKD